MVKVSVIVPVYNVEKYLAKCLESLVSQTINPIEIIVINDGSTDSCKNIIDEYVKRYPNMVHGYDKINGGLSDARNFGLQYCSGEYVGFLDSDDYVTPNIYEKLYIQAKLNDSDIVACDYYKVYSGKQVLVKAKKADTKKEMLIEPLAAAWNKIYKKDILINSKITFPRGLIYEDTEFYCKLIPFINKIDYVPEALVFYVQREGSIANTQGRQTEQIINILNNIIVHYRNMGLYDSYYTELEYLYLRIIFGSSMERMCRIGDRRLRVSMIFKALKSINEVFPGWKKNSYINSGNNLRNLYIKLSNKYTMFFFSELLHIILSIKNRKLKK